MPPNQAPDNGPDSLYFMAPEDRRALRRRLLALRAALPDRETADAQIAAALAPLLERLGVQRLGFYWPIQQEFDVRDTVTRWLAAMPGRVAALPIVSRPAAPLDFHAWAPDTTMRAGQYGIPVPDGTGAVTPDALLIPCVGFSADKFRLGYGGGFYDRTLDVLRGRGGAVTAVGVGFDAQCVASVPKNSGDQPLDWLVTERRAVAFA